MKNNLKKPNGSALRLKKTRQQLAQNQKNFAKELGFTNTYLSELEAGERNISHNVIMKLADKYNISPNWILLGKGPMFFKQKENLDSNESLNLQQMDPNLKLLNWYCKNSPMVKHSVLGYFFRLLRIDKAIIEDDVKINQSSKEKNEDA